MGETTKIEWCDATLNLWWGCTKVSGGCKNCYAEKLSDQRYKKGAWGPGGTRTEVKSWGSTLEKISRRAKVVGRRLRVFCQSMSDTFEGPETCGGEKSVNWSLMVRLRSNLMDEIERHPEIDFLLLTKRPDQAYTYLRHRFEHVVSGTGGYDDHGTEVRLPFNLWIGTSVEDQKTADERIPELLKIPAAVRFLSCEPLLGWVDLTRTIWPVSTARGAPTVQGFLPDKNEPDDWRYWIKRYGIHWVICGGESGPNARPMHPDWARSLRNQCEAAGVPFYFKQWGEWFPLNGSGIPRDEDDETNLPWVWLSPDGEKKTSSFGSPDRVMIRSGKARAGRLLDGREWSQFPEVNP